MIGPLTESSTSAAPTAVDALTTTPDPPPVRASRIIIDLDAYAANVQTVLRVLAPGTRLMAVVKADAYGHGAIMIARTALAAGATHLAVATVTEGVRLRAAGVSAPILVLSPIDQTEIAPAVRHDLSLTVADQAFVERVAASAATIAWDAPIALHVKVDTGMRRSGAMPDRVASVARRVVDAGFELAGLYTHLATADEADEAFVLDQALRFDACVRELRSRALYPHTLHMANSAATLRSRRYDYDMVRLGVALYGLPPSADVPLLPGMRPVMSVRSRVARIIPLSAGDTVGYGRTYRAEGEERAALVPIGYADGYVRSLSNRAWMGLDGAKALVRGRVSMDQTVVGLPPGTDAAVGDPIAVAGDEGPSVTELAEIAGTINYEIVTGFALRLPRAYRRDGRILMIDDERRNSGF